MKQIELHPIREWQEKDGDKLMPSIRIYIGNLHVGTLRRKNKQEELYSFDSFFEGVTENMDTFRYKTIEEHKMQVELCWKEHAAKFVKSLRTLIPIRKATSTAEVKVMAAPPSKRFVSPLKKDGNGKR